MNQNTNVNVVPSYGQRGELHFSQYDVGRTATINLYGVNEAFSIPASSTVKIQATKPSGLGFNESCTYSGNVVTVVCTETMTEECGRFPCELQITKDSDIIGTANFMFCVEASPHPDGTIDGDSEEIINEISALVLQAEGYAVGTQNGVPVTSESPYYHNNAKYYSENVSLSEEFKQALLNCFNYVAWIDGNGQTYVDALALAMNPEAVLVSISAVYTQSGTVYDTDSLDSLKNDLVVTAHYDDSSSQVVTGYTLSGTLEVGTSVITVSYGGKTTTFNVTVSALSIKVYNGKGTSGTSIIDNANRALSEMIYVGDLTRISTQNTQLSSFVYATKGVQDSTTMISTGYNLVPLSYIGTSNAIGVYDVYTGTSEVLYASMKNSNGKWAYIIPESGYIRLLFKKDSAGTSPIPSISGSIMLNDVEYQLIERPASEFE